MISNHLQQQHPVMPAPPHQLQQPQQHQSTYAGMSIVDHQMPQRSPYDVQPTDDLYHQRAGARFGEGESSLYPEKALKMLLFLQNKLGNKSNLVPHLTFFVIRDKNKMFLE